eukprot:jgi/Bigna1/87586/estExt_fgenesh1_pg.C_220034
MEMMAPLCTRVTLLLLSTLLAVSDGLYVKGASDRFWKDGQVFQVKAGAMHYSRIPPAYWRDRLLRLRAMGLNALQTYIPWNFHEEERGVYNFEGTRDLFKFLDIAEEVGLVVVLRAGPYMCGEWEFGGFPAWFLSNGSILLRTDSEPYISYALEWWRNILSRVRSRLYSNGGMIVAVQVENEFGSFGNVADNPSDARYMRKLIDEARTILGNEAILFTTDGGNVNSMLHGSFNDSSVITVGDGCSNVTYCWEAQKSCNPPGMAVPWVSEFYTGTNGSVSLYMVHGALVSSSAIFLLMREITTGTNTAFWAGANGDETREIYQPDVTSYDYDAPIAEGGEHGYGSDGIDKYSALAAVFKRYWNPKTDGAAEPPQEPELLPRKAIFGGQAVHMGEGIELLRENMMNVLSPDAAATNLTEPVAMERLGCYYGLILYSSVLAQDLSGSNLSIPHGPRDRAHILVGGKLIGLMSRTTASTGDDDFSLILPDTAVKGARLDILVENMGRINFAQAMMNETKGLPNGVVLIQQANDDNDDDENHDDDLSAAIPLRWEAHCLPLRPNQIEKLPFPKSPSTLHIQPSSISLASSFQAAAAPFPRFFRSQIDNVPEGVVDTYLDMSGWGKGYVWVNSHNIGRYWSVGPQARLYVPAPFLDAKSSLEVAQGKTPIEIVILELDYAHPNCTVTFSDKPLFVNVPVHGLDSDK